MEIKDKQQLQKLIENKATVNFGISLKEANSNQFYKCVSMAVRDLLTEQRYEFKKQARKQQTKQIYYMSMEFLLGRSLKNHLFNMGITDAVSEIASTSTWDRTTERATTRNSSIQGSRIPLKIFV